MEYLPIATARPCGSTDTSTRRSGCRASDDEPAWVPRVTGAAWLRVRSWNSRPSSPVQASAPQSSAAGAGSGAPARGSVGSADATPSGVAAAVASGGVAPASRHSRV